MTTRVLVDMNLSPEWIPVLRGYGWDAVHWTSVGDPRARDAEIMARARAERFVVFTHAGDDINVPRAPRRGPAAALASIEAVRKDRDQALLAARDAGECSYQ
jgi:predicted nuclease of predicted toxin-antitoxin system